jgi:hypothetical protein
VAVIGFETEATEYMVCGVAPILFSMFAQPQASSQTSLPFLATATATDGSPSVFIFWRIDARTLSHRSVAFARPVFDSPAQPVAALNPADTAATAAANMVT